MFIFTLKSKIMKKINLLLFCFLTAFSAFSQLKIKDAAPLSDVKMKNVDGTEITLKEAKGEKGLIVIFSCNTCPFVVGTPDFPGWERQYNEIAKLAKENNINVVLVNSNEAKRANADSFEEMQKRAKEQSYSMPYLVDTDSKVANAFGAKTTPHIYFFDSNLNLIYTGSIDNIWDNKRKTDVPYLKNAIQAVGSGKKIKEDNTAPKGCSIKRVQQ